MQINPVKFFETYKTREEVTAWVNHINKLSSEYKLPELCFLGETIRRFEKELGMDWRNHD